MDQETRAKILDATVRLFFATPHAELTTRQIAHEAQVNIAAINYHFRSKDELINLAMETATAKAFELGLKVLLAPGRDPIERLREFLSGYVKGLVEFSGLTRAAFLALFRKEESGSFYVRYLKEMIAKVGEVIAEARGPGAAQDSGATALMVLSCVVFPFLVANTARDAGAVDYSDQDARRRYIDTTLALLVGGKQ
jgi:AcrR family transcriptional regulator